jgi:glutamine synthetase
VFFRETARAIAQQHGVIASFMPKPFEHLAGSGAHLHLSLFKDGHNLFYDPADQYDLSQTAKYFIGGILKHLRAICAFTAATVNSYKRLVPHHWASAYTCYGLDNREAAVRVVTPMQSRKAASFNLELKCVDPACNPYLAVLASLAAGIDGIKHQIDPGQPVLQDPYDLTEPERQERGITRLPTTLGEAVDALEADVLFKEILGEIFWDEYIMLKRFAWTRYIEHVSDWEIQTYAEIF